MSLRSGLAFRMRIFVPPGLPTSIAGRLQVVSEWLAGPELVDENGEPTGERGPPLITKAQALRMLGEDEL